MFNKNIRYMCEREGLSQQKFADIMGVKRGKVAAYFYKSTPKAEFQRRFASKFNIDLGLFLTEEMDENNYSSFFTEKTTNTTNLPVVNEPSIPYIKKSEVIDILMKIKDEADMVDRNRLVDQVISIYGRVLEENGILRTEVNILQKDLLDIARRKLF